MNGMHAAGVELFRELARWNRTTQNVVSAPSIALGDISAVTAALAPLARLSPRISNGIRDKIVNEAQRISHGQRSTPQDRARLVRWLGDLIASTPAGTSPGALARLLTELRAIDNATRAQAPELLAALESASRRLLARSLITAAASRAGTRVRAFARRLRASPIVTETRRRVTSRAVAPRAPAAAGLAT